MVILVGLPLLFGSNQPLFWFYGQCALQLLTLVVLWRLAGSQLKLTAAFQQAMPAILTLTLFCFMQAFVVFWPSSGISMDLHASKQELIKSICLLEIFCLTLLLVRSRQQLGWLVRVLVYAGTFQAIYGTMMTVSGIEMVWMFPKEVGIGVATGTFINRNHLAGYLEMTLALGIGLMLAQMTPSKHLTWRAKLRAWTETLLGEKVRIRVCLILMVIALILTRSRMGNISFFVGLGVAGLIGLYLFRKSNTSIVLLFTSILAIDVFLMGAYFGIDKLQERFEQTNLEAEPRTSTYVLAAELIEDRPLFGYGGGSFYTVFPRVNDGTLVGFFKNADADVVEFPIEYGLVGAGLMLLVYLMSLMKALQVQIRRNNQFYRAMGFAAMMAMVSIGFHSTADFNLHIFANAATFVVILAIPWLAMTLPTDRQRGSP